MTAHLFIYETAELGIPGVPERAPINSPKVPKVPITRPKRIQGVRDRRFCLRCGRRREARYMVPEGEVWRCGEPCTPGEALV